MKVLTIGDVVSSQGCEYLRKTLPSLKAELGADVVIVNGENSAVGNGISPQSANYILDSGADAITLGNHGLRRKEIYAYLDDETKPIIRPANLHESAPGRGYMIIDKGRFKLAVVNLQGAVFMEPIENPFSAVDRVLGELEDEGVRNIIIDFHAEATSEKKALAYYLDGRASAIFGTHTHTQTSDNQILPNGTGFVTDIGMTGPYYSVLGVDADTVIEKLKTGLPVKFKNPDGPCVLEGCLFEVDEASGKTLATTLIRR